MHELLTSEPFLLTLILGSYLTGVYLYTRSRMALLHPVIISIGIIVGVLKWAGIDYGTFYDGSYIIRFMLGPSVVALGYVLYEQAEHLKGKVLSIMTSVTVGSFVGIASVIFVCRMMNVEQVVIVSLESKSVTTPIALSLSERSGGILSLTAITVVLCGILGSIMGPFILKMLRVKSRVATGLALGSASHGIGTARAIELGAVEGAISGLAIGLMGIMTSLMIPLMEKCFL
ncbi:MAG: LrgB family protein [Coprobacter sp.]|nr:LrgB family protein [Coprobacter sp.]